MKKAQSSLMIILFLFILTGCADYASVKKRPKVDISGLEPGRRVNSSAQALCDVDRTRARIELLRRLHIEAFRKVAMKVSKEITSEDISNLKQLEMSRRSGFDLPWEIGRRRNELIKEIYSGAMIRAGFKPSNTDEIQLGSLSYTVGINALSSGSDSYVVFLVGNLGKEPGREGEISQILFGATPDQRRYYIGLNQFSRFETQADNTRTPIYATLSLFDSVEGMLPHYCYRVETALNLDEFNTIEGLSLRDLAQL